MPRKALKSRLLGPYKAQVRRGLQTLWLQTPLPRGVQSPDQNGSFVRGCFVFSCFRAFVAELQFVSPGSMQPRSAAEDREEPQLQVSREDAKSCCIAWRLGVSPFFVDHKNTKAPKALPRKELDESSQSVGHVIGQRHEPQSFQFMPAYLSFAGTQFVPFVDNRSCFPSHPSCSKSQLQKRLSTKLHEVREGLQLRMPRGGAKAPRVVCDSNDASAKGR
jgi:hypothetical protein